MLEISLLFATALFVFFIHPPRPGQLVFMTRVVNHGLFAAMPNLVGQVCAYAIQIAIAAIGIIGIIQISSIAMIALKWLGVFYLIWFGLNLMRNDKSDHKKSSYSDHSSMFRQGFVGAITNSTTMLLVIALFPQFLSYEYSIGMQVFLFALIYLLMECAFMVFYGFATQKVAVRTSAFKKIRSSKMTGFFMIIAAIFLSFKQFDELGEETGR